MAVNNTTSRLLLTSHLHCCARLHFEPLVFCKRNIDKEQHLREWFAFDIFAPRNAQTVVVANFQERMFTNYQNAHTPPPHLAKGISFTDTGRSLHLIVSPFRNCFKYSSIKEKAPNPHLYESGSLSLFQICRLPHNKRVS